MELNLKQTIRGELYNSYSYLERLHHAIFDLSGLEYHPAVKEFNLELTKEMGDIIADSSGIPLLIQPTSSCIETRELFEKLHQLIDYLLNFPGELQLKEENLIKIINKIYQACYDYHYFCFVETDLVIELPRGLAQRISLQEKETHGYKISEVEDNVEYDHEEEWMSETDLVLFKVNLEDLKINAKESGTILSFNKARFKNYKNLLRQGAMN